jgi:hypothetical protein
MSRSYTTSPPKRLRGVLWDSFSFTNLFLLDLFNDAFSNFNYVLSNDLWKGTEKEDVV